MYQGGQFLAEDSERTTYPIFTVGAKEWALPIT